MKTIVKEVPGILAFPVDPEDPAGMNARYPYMYTIMKTPEISLVPDPESPDHFIVLIFGRSMKMDALENVIFYGGVLGRNLMKEFPQYQGKINKIIMFNLVKYDSVPDADPQDGKFSVTWPKKTIRYTNSSGKYCADDVDLQMVYVDTNCIQDPEGNKIAQYAWLWHGGDVEALADKELAQIWKQMLKEAGIDEKDKGIDLQALDEAGRNEASDFWKDFENPSTRVEFPVL